MIETVPSKSKEVAGRAPPKACAGSRAQRSRWARRTSIPRSALCIVSRSTASGWTSSPVTAAEFRRFVRETGYVTVAERPLDPALTTRTRSRAARTGSLVFRKTSGPGRTSTTTATGGSTSRARTGSGPGGQGTTINGRDRHPVVHVAYEDAEAYAAGPARSCRPRPSGSTPRAAGSTAPTFAWGDEHFPDGKPMANTLAGRVPVAEPEARRLRGDLAGRQLPAERLRPLRHDAGTSGSGRRDWFTTRHADEVASPCCVPRNPRVTVARRELRPRSAGRAHPAPRDQGRLAPLRAELLPALPPRRAAGADDRHLDGAPRLPLRRPYDSPRERRSRRPDGRQTEHPRDLGR